MLHHSEGRGYSIGRRRSPALGRNQFVLSLLVELIHANAKREWLPECAFELLRAAHTFLFPAETILKKHRGRFICLEIVWFIRVFI